MLLQHLTESTLMPYIKRSDFLPREIAFPSYGDQEEGYLTVAASDHAFPFDVKRSFWTCDTPTDVSRGRHAHHGTEMVLVCLKGWIKLDCESITGEKTSFHLENSGVGIYIPKLTWHEMWYSEEAIQLVFASTYFSEADYIRSYDEFLSIKQNWEIS